MATIGQQLLTPEAGWKRYDDTSAEIKKQGQVVNTGSGTGKFKGTSTPLTATLPKIYFDFVGEEIVIRSFGNYGNYKVIIDGIDAGNSNISGSTSYEVTFIKTNLSPGRHKVELQWVDSTVYFDSIDIKNEGRLLHPDEVLTLDELEIGKRIRVHYQAIANTVGSFNGLGQETSDFIPPASSATPNGDFYFIMVEKMNGKKLLLADRNVQHSISWDVLNSEGIASGSGLEQTKSIIRRIPLRKNISTSYPLSALTGGETYKEMFYFATDPTFSSGAFISNTWLGQNGYVQFSYDDKIIVKEIEYLFGNGGGMERPQTIRITTSESGLFNDEVELAILNYTNYSGTDLLHANTVSSKHYRMYITWVAGNGLNGQGITKYHLKGILETDYLTTVRLLTGGISASDNDNEWDRYLAGASFGGSITPGDNNVWNWSGIYTLTSTTSTAPTRIVRGNQSLINWASVTASELNSKSGNTGFRPVLEIESLYNRKYLINDGGILKTYLNNSWQSLGLITASPELFELYGMDSLAQIDDASIKLLTSNTPKVLVISNSDKAKLKVTHTPKPQTVIGQKDVDISLVESITSNISFAKGASSLFRIIVSTDKGTTWQAFNNTTSSWETTQLSSISTKGIDVEAFNALTVENWKPLIMDNEYLRFAYYLEYHENETVKVDNHDIQLDMYGSWKAAVHGFDYDYDYPRKDKLRVYLYRDGNYKINY
ncbi:hypothetical protein ACPA0F_18155 [Solibacillus silvestris]